MRKSPPNDGAPSRWTHDRRELRPFSGSFVERREHVQKGTTAMITIRADEIRLGDVVVHDGRDHAITHVDRRAGWAWPIAADDTGWAIAPGHQVIHVHRIAPRSSSSCRAARIPMCQAATSNTGWARWWAVPSSSSTLVTAWWRSRMTSWTPRSARAATSSRT